MAAIDPTACPGCGIHPRTDRLADLPAARDLHRQLVHGSLTRSNDRGQQAGR